LILEYQELDSEQISEILSEIKQFEAEGIIEKPSIKAGKWELAGNKLTGVILIVVGVLMIVGLWNAGWIATLPAGIIGAGIHQLMNRRAR